MDYGKGFKYNAISCLVSCITFILFIISVVFISVVFIITIPVQLIEILKMKL